MLPDEKVTFFFTQRPDRFHQKTCQVLFHPTTCGLAHGKIYSFLIFIPWINQKTQIKLMRKAMIKGNQKASIVSIVYAARAK